MSESNVVTPPDSFTIAILEAALAERDKRIAELEKELSKEKALVVYAIERRDAKIMELEDTIKKIAEVIHRDGDPSQWAKNFQDLESAINEAEKLVGEGR